MNTTSQVTGTGVPPGGPAAATLNATPAFVPTLSGWMLAGPGDGDRRRGIDSDPGMTNPRP